MARQIIAETRSDEDIQCSQLPSSRVWKLEGNAPFSCVSGSPGSPWGGLLGGLRDPAQGRTPSGRVPPADTLLSPPHGGWHAGSAGLAFPQGRACVVSAQHAFHVGFGFGAAGTKCLTLWPSATGIDVAQSGGSEGWGRTVSSARGWPPSLRLVTSYSSVRVCRWAQAPLSVRTAVSTGLGLTRKDFVLTRLCKDPSPNQMHAETLGAGPPHVGTPCPERFLWTPRSDGLESPASQVCVPWAVHAPGT